MGAAIEVGVVGTWLHEGAATDGSGVAERGGGAGGGG